jgi:hypothetical protein
MIRPAGRAMSDFTGGMIHDYVTQNATYVNITVTDDFFPLPLRERVARDARKRGMSRVRGNFAEHAATPHPPSLIAPLFSCSNCLPTTAGVVFRIAIFCASWPGFVPAIHDFDTGRLKDVDARAKRGHDGNARRHREQ